MVVHYNTGHLGIKVGDNIYVHIVVMEIIFAGLWVIGTVALLVLVGCLLQGCLSRGSYCLKDRLLPDHLELFRQRNRPERPIYKRFPRLK